ncbi:hypothetical protein BS78_02G371900 [Paspalum vaginatum]|nr:hypothetical protein BS78_02G371900 [Paspalum vaginatum]
MQTLVLPVPDATAAAVQSPPCAQPLPRLVSVSVARAPQRESDPKKRVVVTGTGVVSVFGNDVAAFYDRLLAGKSGAARIDRFDASGFSTRFAAQIRGFSCDGHIDRESDRRLDDCQRYALVAARKALESSGLAVGSRAMGKIDQYRAGVVIGSGLGGVREFSASVHDLVTMGPKKISACSIPLSMLARTTRSRRPAPRPTTASTAPRTRSAWDARTSWSRVLESLEHAMRRGAPILAEYLGGAATCDAHHLMNPRPDGRGASLCIRRRGTRGGETTTAKVNYVNAHATSSPAGDLAEVEALKQVFKNPSRTKMNATKSMIGHCLGAAGGLEAIATIKAITTGWVHPTINQFNPDPAVDEFDTVREVKQWHEVQTGMPYVLYNPSPSSISNSFGFGGHNSVVVFAPFRP